MDMMTFKVEGMHCDGCAERVRTLLDKEPGVRGVRVSFAERCAEVRYNPHRIGEDRLREIIENGGFHVLARIA